MHVRTHTRPTTTAPTRTTCRRHPQETQTDRQTDTLGAAAGHTAPRPNATCASFADASIHPSIQGSTGGATAHDTTGGVLGGHPPRRQGAARIPRVGGGEANPPPTRNHLKRAVPRTPINIQRTSIRPYHPYRTSGSTILGPSKTPQAPSGALPSSPSPPLPAAGRRAGAQAQREGHRYALC